jgi:hypothetical protein
MIAVPFTQAGRNTGRWLPYYTHEHVLKERTCMLPPSPAVKTRHANPSLSSYLSHLLLVSLHFQFTSVCLRYPRLIPHTYHSYHFCSSPKTLLYFTTWVLITNSSYLQVPFFLVLLSCFSIVTVLLLPLCLKLIAGEPIKLYKVLIPDQ